MIWVIVRLWLFFIRAASANSARIHEALQAQLTQHGYQLSQSGVAYVSMSQVASENLTQCSQDPLGEQIQDSSSDESSSEKSTNKAQPTPKRAAAPLDIREDIDASTAEESSDECSAASTTMSQPEEAVTVDQRDDQHVVGEHSKEAARVIRESIKEDCDKCTFFKRELARRNAEIRRLRKVMADINREKVARDDHTLSLSRELQDLKENRKIPSVSFTYDSAIDITLEELKAIDGQSTSDSMFVANLAIHFFGADRLRNMSVTGKPTPRFKRVLKDDGSLFYPAREKIDPTIYKFICEKLSERVAIRLGPSKVNQITYFADEKRVRKALAVKISNLNKAAVKRASRNPRI
ncbi:uncharacterized protein LOC135717449 [Ochlerotatus camptorhynchus]|uniref:uncharacterized protein LOC135717449 n=1 Tax=Ochlerotatus camptorhynchus TaxID=644619 RepID=UPI0031E198A9